MIDRSLNLLSREELKDYIFKLQKFIQDEQEAGKDIDTILDETDISVASSAGVDELKVGVASAVPKYSISLIWCMLPLTTEVT